MTVPNSGQEDADGDGWDISVILMQMETMHQWSSKFIRQTESLVTGWDNRTSSRKLNLSHWMSTFFSTFAKSTDSALTSGFWSLFSHLKSTFFLHLLRAPTLVGFLKPNFNKSLHSYVSYVCPISRWYRWVVVSEGKSGELGMRKCGK